MQIDDELCTEVFLSNLLAYAPNNDDKIDVMKKYLQGPPEACVELDLPEQFTVEVFLVLFLHYMCVYAYSKSRL